MGRQARKIGLDKDKLITHYQYKDKHDGKDTITQQ